MLADWREVPEDVRGLAPVVYSAASSASRGDPYAKSSGLIEQGLFATTSLG